MSEDGDDAEQTMVRRAPVANGPSRAIGHFLTYTQAGETRRVAVGPLGVVVGRLPPCEIVIPSAELSRRHCRIALDGERASVSDLGSTNGTFLGGERLAAPALLQNGSLVSVGGVIIRYEQRDLGDVAQEAELAGELRRASDYVRAILPQPITTGPVQAEWWFTPSSQLGGDAFGYQFLDDDTFVGFVLDVSGHGIGSAMHAMTVANALRRRTLPDMDFADPSQVAAGLNAAFPMEDHNGLMLTLWYFVYHVAERRLRFCAAGHHPSFLVSPQTPEPVPLWLRSPAIGMLPNGRWTSGQTVIPPGSRLFVFSDGAFEIVAANGQAWVVDDLRRIMQGPEHQGVPETQRIYQAIRAAARPGPLDDDVSLLLIRFA